MRIPVLLAVSLVGLAVAAGSFYVFGRSATKDAARPPAPPSERRPSLYCEFYDMMRASVVVSFDFAVTSERGALRFSERTKVESGSNRTSYGEGERPIWAYGLEDETPTLSSPDRATEIKLFGLKSKAPGVFWTEAGLRSNSYRNLEGKCRQAHLDTPTG